MTSLYHVTDSGKVDSILEDGLIGRSYENSPRRIDMAEHGLNKTLDYHGRKVIGEQYQPRDGSVFFFASLETARENCTVGSSILEVAVKKSWLPLVYANDAAVEELFGTFREGYLNGAGTSAGGLEPAYDTEKVEAKVKAILSEEAGLWKGSEFEGAQVWGIAKVSPDRISVVEKT